MKTMLTAAMALLLLLVNPSSSNSLKRLTDSLTKRRLIPISFNDKMCVDFGGWDWLTPYDGDYTYTGMFNGKPAYQMTTCRHSDNCKSGHVLNAGTNGKWQFGSQTQDPFCWDITATADQCTNWWGGRNPVILPCGNQQTADNGISQPSQEQTDQHTACEAAGAEPKRISLTQADKDELLRQFNVQRTRYGQSTWTWSLGLEMVAQATSDMCQGGHPFQGPQIVEICKQYSNNDPNCWAAGTQGTSGPLDHVNGFLWDGYKNGDCVSFGKGIVWSFMQDDHRYPMTGEQDALWGNNHQLTSVGCAYKYCESIGGGFMACNYM